MCLHFYNSFFSRIYISVVHYYLFTWTICSFALFVNLNYLLVFILMFCNNILEMFGVDVKFVLIE